jgi:hypothetical protein
VIESTHGELLRADVDAIVNTLGDLQLGPMFVDLPGSQPRWVINFPTKHRDKTQGHQIEARCHRVGIEILLRQREVAHSNRFHSLIRGPRARKSRAVRFVIGEGPTVHATSIANPHLTFRPSQGGAAGGRADGGYRG